MSRLLPLLVAALFALRCSVWGEEAALPTAGPLPVSQPVSTMAMTEDGQFLIVGHEAENLLSIIAVSTNTLVKSVPCTAPRHLIVRRGKCYVANYGKGTISVITVGGEWALTDQLLVGNDSVYYLSAPQGKYFKDELLATCGESSKREVHLVDTAKDQHRLVRNEIYTSVATVDYRGRGVVQQGEFNHSPSAVPERRDYVAYLAGRNEGFGRGEHDSTPFLFQVADGDWWSGGNRLYRGETPKPFKDPQGDAVIPDADGELCYVVRPRQVEVRQLAEEFSLMATATMGAPGDGTPLTARQDGCKPVPNLAAKDDAAIHLYYVTLDRNAVQYLRLDFGALEAAPGTPTAAPASASAPPKAPELPARIVEGQPFTYALAPPKTKGQFAMASGPANAKLDETGKLTWTPTANEVGVHQLKVRVVVDGQTTFQRYTIEVVAAELAKLVDGKLEEIGQLGRHALKVERSRFAPLPDYSGVLLHTEAEVRVLDPSGLKVMAAHTFEHPYLIIHTRPEYWVGLHADGLDLIDPKTFAVKRTIACPGDDLNGLALHPRERLAYVGTVDRATGRESKLRGCPVYCIDEESGKATLLPQVFGQALLIDPSGQYLYTVYRETIMQGPLSYELIDLLFCFSLKGASATAETMNEAPGANGRKLRIAPDGWGLSYVAGGGYREGPKNLTGYTIPVFKLNNVERAFVSYNVGAYPTDVAYHPYLPLVAATNGKSIQFFQRDNGEPSADRITLSQPLKEITQLLFSPNGRYLLVEGQTQDGGRLLQACPLTLDDAERAKVTTASGPPTPLPPPAPTKAAGATGGTAAGGSFVAAKPAQKALELLTQRAAQPREVKEIVATTTPAIALIVTPGGFGTGFFISAEGHLVTCAHVLPEFGKLTAKFQVARDGLTETIERPLHLLAVDPVHDLALLQVDAGGATVATVKFEKAGLVEAGGQVLVIGNPGLGDNALTNTVSQGIVSTVARRIENLEYIQSTAAINPGNSGGPMFNDRGNVIGVVVARADLEGVGFAVPILHLYQFLSANTAP